MKILLVAVLFLANAPAFAQSKPDEDQVNLLVDDLIASFNSHDFKTLEVNSTKDVSWVNMMGRWWKGRDEVVSAHKEIFNKIFNGVKFEKKSVSMRFLSADIVVVHVIEHVDAFFPPDGVDRGGNKRPASDDNLQLVYLKTNGKWLLSAAHNTEVQPGGPPVK